MKEVLRLRPHHASVLFDYYNVSQERIAEALNSYGYDEETKRTILEIIDRLHDPQTLIEILPNGDIGNDAICQQCVIQKQLSRCGDPSIFGRLTNDKWESRRLGLTTGDILTSVEMLKRVTTIKR